MPEYALLQLSGRKKKTVKGVRQTQKAKEENT